MRWTQLFAELEAQFEAQEEGVQRAEEASRTRAELGRVRLVERLAGAVTCPVVITCRGVGDLRARLDDVGVDWLLLTDDSGREVLVALGAVRAVGGLRSSTGPAPDDGPVRSRLDLRRALRGLARDRRGVQVLLDDGSVFGGTLDRVGADHVELAEHPADLARRRDAVRGVRAVALDAVAAVRSVDPGTG